MLKQIANNPVKFGLALSHTGTYILGPSGVASIAGIKSTWVDVGVAFGFSLCCAGVFITTLYTNGTNHSMASEAPAEPKTTTSPKP